MCTHTYRRFLGELLFLPSHEALATSPVCSLQIQSSLEYYSANRKQERGILDAQELLEEAYGMQKTFYSAASSSLIGCPSWWSPTSSWKTQFYWNSQQYFSTHQNAKCETVKTNIEASI